MLFKGRKGQAEASNAATLVALIAGIILLYILFLPPSERQALLEGNETTTNGEDNETTEGNITLFSESPGRIDFLSKETFEHDIPSFTLYKTTNAYVLARVNPFYIKNSWFDEKTKQATFKVDDLENTQNVVLTFTPEKHKGILTIKLNSESVFESEITAPNIPPISLPKSLLKGENTLDFSVSESGWAFWSANTYSLQDVQIIGDVTDISRQESKNTFYITGTEAFNLESAKLKFNPDCKPTQVGILQVIINSQTVFSGVPDCGALNIVEFSPDILESGTNKVIFKTEMGSYLIDQIKVETRLKELVYPTYYFELTEKQYQEIADNEKEIILHFEFVREDAEDREMEVNVNGRKFTVEIDKGDTTYSKNIGMGGERYVRRGENYIKIIPLTTLEIVKIKVTLG